MLLKKLAQKITWQPINRTMYYFFFVVVVKYHQCLHRFFKFNSLRLLSMACLGNKNLYWVSKNCDLTKNTGFMSSLPPPLLRQFLPPQPASNCLIHPPSSAQASMLTDPFTKWFFLWKPHEYSAWAVFGYFSKLDHHREGWDDYLNKRLCSQDYTKAWRTLTPSPVLFRKWLSQLGATGKTLQCMLSATRITADWAWSSLV